MIKSISHYLIYLLVVFVVIKGTTSNFAFGQREFKKRIVFFPQVHYIQELETMEPKKKETISLQILKSQFYIYHQLLAKLEENPDLAVFNESFYFSKLELYRILSKKENKLRRKYRIPAVRHEEFSLMPNSIEKELASQIPEKDFYHLDWQANRLLHEGLVRISIPKSYKSQLPKVLPKSLEELSQIQKKVLIKYGAGDLLVLQGHIKNAKATSETGKRSGYHFLRKIENYKSLTMDKRKYSRKNILSMCPDLVRAEPDFAKDLQSFLLNHPHSQGGFLAIFDPLKFWLEETNKNKVDQECIHCASINAECQEIEDQLLNLMHIYHVYLTREQEVVFLINDFLSRQEDNIENDEVVLIYGAAHEFAEYFNGEVLEFVSLPDSYSHFFDESEP
ncbi:MAG: hypothetical protein AB8G05_18005 [Oligoflexales bacterium]